MTRLPGWSYRGGDPNGFMSAREVAGYLQSYARSFYAPVVNGAAVHAVDRRHGRYRVVSDAGEWSADAVVLAAGFCDQLSVPHAGGRLHPSIYQLTSDRYRNPADVPDGGVLVVGASATGAQLADELAGTGKDVVLSVGRHTRLPRRYRGRDIFWWLDSMGVLDRVSERHGHDRPATPSLQIVGSVDGREIDLPSLVERGIRLAGRVVGVSAGSIAVADDLPATTAAADMRLAALLQRVDEHAAITGPNQEVGSAHRPRESTGVRAQYASTVDLPAAGIRSVIWATGYRRHYPWLRVPVLDAAGEIMQTAGRTPARGLMVVGHYRQTRPSSSSLDGVRWDAAVVVDHLRKEILGRTGASRRAS